MGGAAKTLSAARGKFRRSGLCFSGMDAALEIKAAVLAQDPSVNVILDEGEFVEPAADATDAAKEAALISSALSQ